MMLIPTTIRREDGRFRAAVRVVHDDGSTRTYAARAGAAQADEAAAATIAARVFQRLNQHLVASLRNMAWDVVMTGDFKWVVPGARVRLREPHDVFPDGIVPAGAIGTITEVNVYAAGDWFNVQSGRRALGQAYEVWVKLDEHIAFLDEWDNQVQLYDYGNESESFEAQVLEALAPL